MTTEWVNILKQAGWPTTVVVIDFETYCTADYSLSKMSTIEYIQDARWKALGVAVGTVTGRQPHAELRPHFWSDVEYQLKYLQGLHGEHFERCTVVAHNAVFDGAILAYRYGIHPPYVVDTLGLARHVDPRPKNDLASLCQRYGLPAKGDTKQFLGLHRADMSDEVQVALARYAENDADREWDLFRILLPQLSRPEFELPLMRHTLNLFWNPCIAVDVEQGDRLAEQMKLHMDKTLQGVSWILH